MAFKSFACVSDCGTSDDPAALLSSRTVISDEESNCATVPGIMVSINISFGDVDFDLN